MKEKYIDSIKLAINKLTTEFNTQYHLFVIGDFKSFSSGSVLAKITEKRFKTYNFLEYVRTDDIIDFPDHSIFIIWDPYFDIIFDKSLLLKIPSTKKIINYTGFNSDKSHVVSVFEDIFGYSLKANTNIDFNNIVQKSRKNAKHDGVIINLENVIVNNKKYHYEKLLNNEIDNVVVDIRVPYIFGDIPFVYLKFREKSHRFKNINIYSEITDVFSVFSYEEYEKILDFCKVIELDYGELDILRNYDDGKIYIIDANNTPYGPPNHINANDYQRALFMLENSFIKTFHT